MKKYKYPRTYHILSSPGATDDDKTLKNLSQFVEKDVVIMEKMDGESSSCSKDYTHARSLDSNNHPSRNWIKGMWAEKSYLLPNDWRICFENVFATHAINYDNLETYAFVLNIWDENNMCLDYDETLEWCTLLGLIHAPVLFRGVFDEKILNNIINNLDLEKQEGIVIRNTNSFHYDDFKNNYGKWVRVGHVQEDSTHWISKPVVPNKLKNNAP